MHNNETQHRAVEVLSENQQVPAALQKEEPPKAAAKAAKRRLRRSPH